MAYQHHEIKFEPVLEWSDTVCQMDLSLEWAQKNKPTNTLIGKVNSLCGIQEVHRTVNETVNYRLVNSLNQTVCYAEFQLNLNKLIPVSKWCDSQYTSSGLLSELFYFIQQHEFFDEETGLKLESELDHFLYNSNSRNLGPMFPAAYFGKGDE
jgi:hypothetical protein